MLRQRVQSAIVIVIAAVVPAVLGHPILTVALLLLAILGVIEFARAVGQRGVVIPLLLVILAVEALILATALSASPVVLVAILTLSSIGIYVALMMRGQIQGATQSFALSLVPIVYIGLPLAHMPLIRELGGSETANWLQSVNNLAIIDLPAEGLGWLVLIVASTWMTDSAAYLGGRAFGRHKLAPVLSPGKTIEGAIAGVITGSLTGALVITLLGLPLPIYVGAMMGLIISAVGQAGDLAESLMKRDLGVKDMGNLIPGHGGILDRIDALLFTLPVGYYLILLAMEVSWP